MKNLKTGQVLVLTGLVIPYWIRRLFYQLQCSTESPMWFFAEFSTTKCFTQFRVTWFGPVPCLTILHLSKYNSELTISSLFLFSCFPFFLSMRLIPAKLYLLLMLSCIFSTLISWLQLFQHFFCALNFWILKRSKN